MTKVEHVGLIYGHTHAMVVCVCGDVFQAEGEMNEVARQEREWSKAHKRCVKQPYGSKTFWLLFCDGERPKGQQFLGACIVTVTPEDVEEAALMVLLKFPLAQPGAEYIGAASRKAHTLGCNPGGEMASMEIPADHPMLAHYQQGVLMDRATIERIDAAIAKAEGQ